MTSHTPAENHLSLSSAIQVHPISRLNEGCPERTTENTENTEVFWVIPNNHCFIPYFLSVISVISVVLSVSQRRVLSFSDGHPGSPNLPIE
jgi:hypothetical protein